MINTKRILFSILFLILFDGIWIHLFMGKKYDNMILDIQGEKLVPNYYYIIGSYILMICGMILFVLPQTENNNSLLKDSFWYGFLFGIITYGIYDFTAGAVFKKWNMKLAFIDIMWGGFIFGIVAYISGKLFNKKIQKNN